MIVYRHFLTEDEFYAYLKFRQIWIGKGIHGRPEYAIDSIPSIKLQLSSNAERKTPAADGDPNYQKGFDVSISYLLSELERTDQREIQAESLQIEADFARFIEQRSDGITVSIEIQALDDRRLHLVLRERYVLFSGCLEIERNAMASFLLYLRRFLSSFSKCLKFPAFR